MLRLRNAVLESIARGESLATTAYKLCTEIEKLLPDAICSAIAIERNGVMRPLAAPSISQTYLSTIDGVMIGPHVGCCGSAAYHAQDNGVRDIAADPRYADYRVAALAEGLRACWSTPIRDQWGEVLGTLALYFREPRLPDARERDVAKSCVELCVIAMERHRRVLERERRASIDALTSLPNRASFEMAVAQLTEALPGTWALMLLDVDNLKTINDTFGHATGDALLQTVAARLASAVHPDPTFRIGGDEFAVIVQDASALKNLERLSSTILDRLAINAECHGHLLLPRATIGVAHSSDAMCDGPTVKQRADYALYDAKEHLRGQYAIYREGLPTPIEKRQLIIRELQMALDEDMVTAFYQPVIKLATGEIVGLEALCRLIRPNGEIVSASAFHEATVDAGVASAITERMIHCVAGDVRRWLDREIPFQHVGINISAADFHSGTLYGRLEATFKRHQVPLQHLILEVTESVYLGKSDPVVAKEVQSLRGRGLRIALDDFGTGFASLTHLMTMPIDIIKIDRSFVGRLSPGDPSVAIVEGLIAIAGKLGLRVIAEGVETQNQAKILARLGCLLGQGYLYGAAQHPDITTDMLEKFAQRVPSMSSQQRLFATGGSRR